MAIFIFQDAQWETSRCQLFNLVLQRREGHNIRLIRKIDSCRRMVILFRTGRQREKMEWVSEVMVGYTDIHMAIQG